jgi:hypothetical protein
MAKKGFNFRDIYLTPMSPKRKSYEKQRNITDLGDIAATNTYYQDLLATQAKSEFDKKACQERQVVNQQKINELLPSKTLLETQVTTLQNIYTTITHIFTTKYLIIQHLYLIYPHTNSSNFLSRT